ncbi:hypothetical protein PHET_02817 [Paragonimus heterotremus]|uniref:Uncharacterized protein n=1 Tax=Paragonimus heterotremus TaxID=100268 RepID=A0A8J4WID2_9TREM|nr:hypothetical protein PHET_02817 [Paragonimus heterotremus]
MGQYDRVLPPSQLPALRLLLRLQSRKGLPLATVSAATNDILWIICSKILQSSLIQKEHVNTVTVVITIILKEANGIVSYEMRYPGRF